MKESMDNWPTDGPDNPLDQTVSEPPVRVQPVVSQQHGFWRSPRGENHGRDSKPGDEWAHEGDITDTDRLRWLVLNFDEDTFFNMPEDFGMAIEYIDELMLANKKAQARRTGGVDCK